MTGTPRVRPESPDSRVAMRRMRRGPPETSPARQWRRDEPKVKYPEIPRGNIPSRPTDKLSTYTRYYSLLPTPIFQEGAREVAVYSAKRPTLSSKDKPEYGRGIPSRVLRPKHGRHGERGELRTDRCVESEASTWTLYSVSHRLRYINENTSEIK